ncbi:hypothetical protein [Dongia sp.]|uniref:hypothetical protein n=1 Tax=Dongia sp. TaxID=1977262 RepID=UPI0035ADD177
MAPVALAQAYLGIAPIDVPQLEALKDIAMAYGAPPDAALGWIEKAVNAEIERQVESVRSQGSWWCRLARSYSS